MGGNYYPASNGHFYFVYGIGTIEDCREFCLSHGARFLEVRNDAQFEASRGVLIEFFSDSLYSSRMFTTLIISFFE